MSMTTALKILQSHGFRQSAADLCRKLNLQNEQNIADLSDGEINGLGLAPMRKRKLKESIT